MWNWVSANLLTTLLLFLFFLTLVYVFWLKFRMAVSKARFALVTVSALVACLMAGLSLISGTIPLQIVSAVLLYLGIASNQTPVIGTLSLIIGAVLTVLAMVLIVRFAAYALRHWEGRLTVSVNELAKECQDDQLLLLAMTEMSRLAHRKPDPLASDAAINWQQKLSPAPATPHWHDLARELFEAAFSEAVFGANAWRDRSKVLVGQIYVSQTSSADTVPLHVFVFEEEPSDEALIAHLSTYIEDGASLDGAKLYAVFDTKAAKSPRKLTWQERSVEIWSRCALLRKGFKLTTYARELIRRFDEEPLGGTTATLKATFVETHVARPDIEERRSLTEVMTEWLADTSRRHLAITGEYGQGKSTAMLNFCVNWARRYLVDGAPDERIPLLIELRGKNPTETDILSIWAGRYGLSPKQLSNLIKAGEAIIIFEGFDELRNAGRLYDRHEHFNALWSKAYPGTKLIFTGRPNFFIDDKERNRTLRADATCAAVGGAFSEVWQISCLIESEICQVVKGFGEQLGNSIMEVTKAHPTFFDIVSRPSMLPVVATIWEDIEGLQKLGFELSSGVLLEKYFTAIYLRKEIEIEKAEAFNEAPGSENYFLLLREIRQTFTLAIVWWMAKNRSRNTISRTDFNKIIASLMDDVFTLYQTEGVPREFTENIRKFENKFCDDTKADKVERISNEIASAGIFVLDSVGGSNNLKLPHKQYYEYMIAKVAWIVLKFRNSNLAKLFLQGSVSTDAYSVLLSEPDSLKFLVEMTEGDGVVFPPSFTERLDFIYMVAIKYINEFSNRNTFFKIDLSVLENNISTLQNFKFRGKLYRFMFTASIIGVIIFMLSLIISLPYGEQKVNSHNTFITLMFILTITPLAITSSLLKYICELFINERIVVARYCALKWLNISFLSKSTESKLDKCFRELLLLGRYSFCDISKSRRNKAALSELITQSFQGLLSIPATTFRE